MCTPWRRLNRHTLEDGRCRGGVLDFEHLLDGLPNRPVFQPPPRQRGESSNGQAAPPSSPRGSRSVATSMAAITKRRRLKRRVRIGSNQSSSTDGSSGEVAGDGDQADDSEWPPFADEDYIVFCFEEDGEFHVVVEENSKPQECSDHGNSSVSHAQKVQGDDEEVNQMDRRDCLLPSKALRNEGVEEERFYFSPRLQSDGIKSLSRFKAEVGDEEDNVMKARIRVDEDMNYEDIEGIKKRADCNGEEEDMECDDSILEYRGSSMDCRNGSLESPGSSQSESETGLPSSQAQENEEDFILSKKMADDEESVYMSSESRRDSQDGDEQSNNGEESARGSAETNDSSRSETEGMQMEESATDSAGSTKSSEDSHRSSSSSFEFPVLEWEWNGSPEKWQRSETVRFRKTKTRRVCLRCCRF